MSDKAFLVEISRVVRCRVANSFVEVERAVVVCSVVANKANNLRYSFADLKRLIDFSSNYFHSAHNDFAYLVDLEVVVITVQKARNAKAERVRDPSNSYLDWVGISEQNFSRLIEVNQKDVHHICVLSIYHSVSSTVVAHVGRLNQGKELVPICVSRVIRGRVRNLIHHVNGF